ncbi:MAG: hypothetical protein AABX95_01070 [Nanoarchaeota archaeon]
METKQVLKNTGKVALTVVSPPIGAMTWVDKKDRTKAFLLGTAVSLVGGMAGNGLYREISSKKIFDNPSICVYEDSSLKLRVIAEAGFIPLALCFDTQPVTEIKVPENNRYWIRILGDNVISYIPNDVSGRYEVNFQDNTPFIFPKESIIFGISSLTDTRKTLENALASGDVLGAKPLAEAYETKRTQYESTRKTLDETVAKMNAELESQRAKLAGDIK